MDDQRKRILIAEDEPHMAFSLQYNLQAEGYDVVLAVNGRIAVDIFERDRAFDLVILDGMLPEMTGFQVAEYIRTLDAQIHILMLTALGKDVDRLRGFEAGADDYITKPFHLKEFLMRVRRMVKRSTYFSHLFHTAEKSSDSTPVLICGPFELNTETLILKTPGGEHSLTAMESDVLKEFMTHHERVLSREHLLNSVWGMRGDIETRTVDNFIVRLRRYLEKNPAEPRYLVSVRGRGYRLVTPPETPT